MKGGGLKQFIGDIHRITEADRADAVDGAPYMQPVVPKPKPRDLRWNTGGLDVEFAHTLEGEYDEEWKKGIIAKVFNVFGSTTEGRKLLKDLSSFPIHPQLPALKKINVAFQDNLLQSTDPNADTDGQFHPAWPAEEYALWIKYKKNAPGPGKWPNTPKNCNILYTHRKDESAMAVILYHELLHIWFVNKYWLYFLQKGNTGHLKVENCEYDIVEINNKQYYPFLDRLILFYKEIDSKEKP